MWRQRFLWPKRMCLFSGLLSRSQPGRCLYFQFVRSKYHHMSGIKSPKFPLNSISNHSKNEKSIESINNGKTFLSDLKISIRGSCKLPNWQHKFRLLSMWQKLFRTPGWSMQPWPVSNWRYKRYLIINDNFFSLNKQISSSFFILSNLQSLKIISVSDLQSWNLRNSRIWPTTLQIMTVTTLLNLLKTKEVEDVSMLF